MTFSNACWVTSVVPIQKASRQTRCTGDSSGSQSPVQGPQPLSKQPAGTKTNSRPVAGSRQNASCPATAKEAAGTGQTSTNAARNRMNPSIMSMPHP